MKETNINAIGPGQLRPGSFGKVSKVQTGKLSDDFDAVLSTATVPDVAGNSTANGPSLLEELSAPLPLIRADKQETDLSSRLASALDLVDQYARLLDDPSKDLRTVDAALTALDQMARDLSDESQSDSAVPKDLSAVIDHLVLTATLERIKLDRGDYLDLPTGS